MTDLEEMWDDYPTGKPPVDKILRDARRIAMAAEAREAAAEKKERVEARRRFVMKPLLTAGVATGIVGAFLAGTLVDGDGIGGADGDSGIDNLPTPAAFAADLEPAKSCDDLLAAFVDRALPLVGEEGWGSDDPEYYYREGYDSAVPLGGIDELDLMMDPDLMENGYAAGEHWALDRASRGLLSYTKASPETKRQTNSDTGTNVQEAGVDEPDSVKTDGELLVRLRDDELIVYDVTGEQTLRESSLDLTGLENGEILLAGDTVVAIGADDTARNRARSRVMSVSIADPRRPEVTDDVVYDGWIMSSRQHGDAVRLVMSSGLPTLDFVEPGDGRSSDEALEDNRKVVRESTIDDWLPTVRSEDGDTAEPLVDCTNVAVPSDELPLDRVSIVGFDASSPTEVEAIGLAGATNIAYESVDKLYLAATPSYLGCFDCFARTLPHDDGNTYLFEFDLDGTSATHVASGEIEGAIADRWAMDAAGGTLRVAVSPTAETGDFTSIVTLESQRQDLVEVGRLDEIGVNEDMKSVRWFDDLAFVVTYRRVDPLFAIDLSDVTAPRKISELKIPGFSEYLHPLGADRLVGIGEGPGPEGRWGAQAGLFDVTDLADVERIDVQVYGGGSEALAASDPRSFTWLPSERTMFTVVAKHNGAREGWLSIMRLEGSELRNTWQKVEYGADVDEVRTVPLSDGRVVLVTGENVEFLDY
ncbi:hypothetical protein HNR19_000469 [Nocardioides thalensis]|uniref:Beta propeller domain-containing protein n=1 Tax=Nocardioides thalensis TaxID=1914755 RepID=A0A853BXT6_9ACTN|nr:beta-propeller domain-containing protein [Nocardioides thalensis]NYI99770.1 hypothetical protein [Nocardioides thalensis]